MPFCKRTILPKDVCKPDRAALRDARPQAEVFGDLADVCGFTLCSVLRQLSDLSRHSVSILEELEGELVSVCRRSCALESRVVLLQRRVTELVSKPPPRTTSGLEAESSRRAHFRSPWQQSVNVFGSWSRPDCVEELHQQAQLNLQSLLQDFEEQLYDSKLTGQTFRHPSSQSSDDTSTSLSRSPVSVNNKRPDFIFLPASKQLYEDETTSSVFGLRSVINPSPSPSPSPCSSDRPLLGCSSNNSSSSSTVTSATTGPPVAEKPRWHLGRRTPHFIPLDITGEAGGGGGGKFHGVDLLQHSPSPSPSLGDPFPHQPRSLELVTDTPHQNLPLRKTHSDLETTLPADNPSEQRVSDQIHQGTMDHSGLLCSSTPSSSWNGPKGSTFSPGAWGEAYSYSTNKGPAVPPKQHSIVVNTRGGTADGVVLVNTGQSVSSHSSSFIATSEPLGRGGTNMAGVSLAAVMMGKRTETEGAAADAGRGGGGGGEGGRGRERSARSIAAANAFRFRERSLSTPTDSDSVCLPDKNSADQPAGNNAASTGNGNVMGITDHQQHYSFMGLGENYAFLYPSGSSEDSTSTADTISVTASDYSVDGRLRLRSRSISLKKSRRKPPPPVRSVSLMKNLGEAEGRIHRDGGLYRDGRPKSLHIPRDHFPDFQPDFLLPTSSCSSKHGVSEGELGHGNSDGPPSLEIQAPDREGETELNFSTHWQLGDWKNDPYRSLSGSSTATGTTVIECMKVRGSSESLLDSPSTSRATSPSQLSVETDIKASSPFKPPGFMSPSSGYSSQSETPTPTVPLSHISGPGTVGKTVTSGCKMRPKIPERKSSLPSPKDPAARSRLSFEMPGNAHLELSSIKPKQKASRRHSDTSTAAKPGKISPNSSQALPMVTQNELKTVRLRAVSRGDLEDCPDGASDTIEEEQHGRDLGEDVSPPPTAPRPKPPVAIKPPLPKRPLNLLLKSNSPSSTSPISIDSPPASPVDRPMPLGNIYKVMKKPKPKKPPPQPTITPSVLPDSISISTRQAVYDHSFLSHSQSLFDLPPLPDPQPLLEDPATEPEFYPDQVFQLGPEEGGSLPSPCSNEEAPELPDKSKTLPSRMTISCLSELSDKKKPKVPPPVPKKPNVLLLPTSVHSSSNGSTDRQTLQADSPVGLRSPVGVFPPEDLPNTPSVPDMPEGDENHIETEEESSKESSLQSTLQDSSLTELEGKMGGAGIGTDDTMEETSSAASETTALHIAEEMDDDLLASTPTTHTTEDLFTIIHRSKRKVLGRKEPSDSFGSRQSLVSPVKHSTSCGEQRNLTMGNSQRSSSRNENFMALLQKKGNKSTSGGARVSAMELLKSTNPLARRVTEFPNSTSVEGGEEASTNGKSVDQ
ncbi:NHS-like protein 2 [Thalassophryne amazonica]|uniref:NHS-like protein 2 n=1 Tax=Thalassophryne amazonica TaxID=390379 RepID=UPI001471F54B|nr:NHS-like protein 2 [Thalassophryne amazonica]